MSKGRPSNITKRERERESLVTVPKTWILLEQKIVKIVSPSITTTLLEAEVDPTPILSETAKLAVKEAAKAITTSMSVEEMAKLAVKKVVEASTIVSPSTRTTARTTTTKTTISSVEAEIDWTTISSETLV